MNSPDSPNRRRRSPPPAGLFAELLEVHHFRHVEHRRRGVGPRSQPHDGRKVADPAMELCQARTDDRRERRQHHHKRVRLPLLARESRRCHRGDGLRGEWLLVMELHPHVDHTVDGLPAGVLELLPLLRRERMGKVDDEHGMAPWSVGGTDLPP